MNKLRIGIMVLCVIIVLFFKSFRVIEYQNTIIADICIHFAYLFFSTSIPNLSKHNTDRLNNKIGIFLYRFFSTLFLIFLVYFSLKGITDNLIDIKNGPLTQTVTIVGLDYTFKGFVSVNTDDGTYNLRDNNGKIKIGEKYVVKIFKNSNI